jgi:hypothetical protein
MPVKRARLLVTFPRTSTVFPSLAIRSLFRGLATLDFGLSGEPAAARQANQSENQPSENYLADPL